MQQQLFSVPVAHSLPIPVPARAGDPYGQFNLQGMQLQGMAGQGLVAVVREGPESQEM